MFRHVASLLKIAIDYAIKEINEDNNPTTIEIEKRSKGDENPFSFSCSILWENRTNKKGYIYFLNNSQVKQGILSYLPIICKVKKVIKQVTWLRFVEFYQEGETLNDYLMRRNSAPNKIYICLTLYCWNADELIIADQLGKGLISCAEANY